MRVAIINEVSARDKNPLIVAALQDRPDIEVFNAGMRAEGAEPELTYIHTGLMAGMMLNVGAVELVVGGCGTGLGFLLSAMQYPGVFAGLIAEPLDAFLFSQINAGNCVSLALNKGFGWAGDVNLRYLFDRLFEHAPGMGYPAHRAKSQRASRLALQDVSRATHVEFATALTNIDREVLRTVLAHGPFMELMRGECADKALQSRILDAYCD